MSTVVLPCRPIHCAVIGVQRRHYDDDSREQRAFPAVKDVRVLTVERMYRTATYVSAVQSDECWHFHFSVGQI